MYVEYEGSNCKTLCFRHATKRAMKGEDIRTKVYEGEEHISCCDCRAADCDHDWGEHPSTDHYEHCSGCGSERIKGDTGLL